ncbi:MacS family sensor histidine kinase [Streptomyces aidingensis]|uniref:Signal transduction histidine kinase n=1 Tax=Streptomyces aidingensis TaxID=910347 RepID=A0A1I1LNE9_9ACTN|nr:DUF5931 domain-containing protein [Streptomyces aidingensis]SFC72488.1 Signal transduction histidine kinase [Streptomyces aidingensis]
MASPARSAPAARQRSQARAEGGGGRLGAALERPLWRALLGYRILTAGYAWVVFGLNYGAYEAQGRPGAGLGYLSLLSLWTLATLDRVSSARRCTAPFLVADMTLAIGGILFSRVADPAQEIGPTLPSIWTAGAVLAVAVRAGWRWSGVAAVLVGLAGIVEYGGPGRSTLHNAALVCVASIAIGYVVEVARASERALAEALRIEAATRERERLARDIHDGVLQVLALVQRRGSALGGEDAELGRLAGEQERALRSLITGAAGPAVPGPRTAPDAPDTPDTPDAPDAPDAAAVRPAEPAEPAELDLRALLAARAGERVIFSGPAGPLPLPAAAARELDAAVGAALDNVRTHTRNAAGVPARAWILLEDEPEAVLITVRDDGPGIAAGRLAAAEAEGRMGVSLSIRGRLRDLGGTADWISLPGQGTEVELSVPRAALRAAAGPAAPTDREGRTS